MISIGPAPDGAAERVGVFPAVETPSPRRGDAAARDCFHGFRCVRQGGLRSTRGYTPAPLAGRRHWTATRIRASIRRSGIAPTFRAHARFSAFPGDSLSLLACLATIPPTSVASRSAVRAASGVTHPGSPRVRNRLAVYPVPQLSTINPQPIHGPAVHHVHRGADSHL
jgi:hypothetical protein